MLHVRKTTELEFSFLDMPFDKNISFQIINEDYKGKLTISVEI